MTKNCVYLFDVLHLIDKDRQSAVCVAHTTQNVHELWVESTCAADLLCVVQIV